MSEAEVLRQMVLSFRVTELQVLLGFAGKNKTGKKNELQARAIELLRQRNTPIFMKIRELHKRYPSSSSNIDLNSGSSSHNEASDSNYNTPSSPVKVSHYAMPHQSMMQVPMNIHPGNPQMGYRSSGSSKHSSMISSSSGSSGFPVHPDVRFKALPFYDILAELLKPTSLCTAPNSGNRFQETNFVFHLTPQQANDVAMSRDVRPNIKNEYSVQIQLRFCLLETSCEQEDNFPPSICVKVNSKMCGLPNPIPTNKPGVEPKRPSRPVNITTLCKLCPTVPNYVTVSWASEYGRGYVIGVYLVKRLNSNTLLQRLRSVGVRNPDHTRAMIKEKLQQDPDSEIATTSLRGSLMCPLGKMRMHIPCRAKTCNHLQCFDASLYLQMNEKKPTWICPVCDKPAIFKDLVIDGLFMEITTKAPSSCNEVQFHDDGNWTPLVAKKEAVTISAPAVKQPSSSSYSSPKRSATSQPEEKKKKQKVEVIDLTCDSSTDEYDDETDTSSPMAVYNTNLTTNSNQSNSNVNQYSNTNTNNENSSSGLPNIPVSIQVISLPSPSSLSSCSNSSNSSHTSNNSTSTNYSSRSATTAATTASSTPPVVTTPTTARATTPQTVLTSTITTTTASISSANHQSSTSRSMDGNSSSNQGITTSTASVQGLSLSSNPLYSSMPILESNSPYYPPVSSPLQDFLNPMYNNYPSFDLYSMLQSTESDRQIVSYNTVPPNMSNRKGSGTTPDIISLD